MKKGNIWITHVLMTKNCIAYSIPQKDVESKLIGEERDSSVVDPEPSDVAVSDFLSKL